MTRSSIPQVVGCLPSSSSPEARGRKQQGVPCQDLELGDCLTNPLRCRDLSLDQPLLGS